jgi:peptidyl-tRNA hydrolase
MLIYDYIYRWHRMGQAKVAVKVDNDDSLGIYMYVCVYMYVWVYVSIYILM